MSTVGTAVLPFVGGSVAGGQAAGNAAGLIPRVPTVPGANDASVTTPPSLADTFSTRVKAIKDQASRNGYNSTIHTTQLGDAVVARKKLLGA